VALSERDIKASWFREPDERVTHALAQGPAAYSVVGWRVILEEAKRRGIEADKFVVNGAGSPSERLARALAAVDPRDSRCHRCGTSQDLAYHTFGRAMIVSQATDWASVGAGVVVSLAASALTSPLLGMAGGSVSARRNQRLQVIRMKLCVCGNCARGKHVPDLYDLHPWSEIAQAFGFTLALTDTELAVLVSAS